MQKTMAQIKRQRIAATLSPQCRKIIAHMEKAGSITNDAAITYYRVMALPRRIADLREAGIDIRTEERKHPSTGQRYRAYFFA